jgi:hypothetical protein
MAGQTYTVADIAERYHMDVPQVIRRCRGAVPWPHRRPNKHKATTWVFTDEDIAAIDEMLAHRGPVVDSWGRERRRTA